MPNPKGSNLQAPTIMCKQNKVSHF